MTVEAALTLLALVIGLGVWLSRRAQTGYLDYLTPLLVMYAINALTRGAMLFYLPEWLALNDQVRDVTEAALVDALWETTLSLAALVASYLIVTYLSGAKAEADVEIAALGPSAPALLLVGGLACRLLLRLAAEDIVPLPGWASTPVETFGWAALGGVFAAGYLAGKARDPQDRSRAWALLIVGVTAILIVDARIAVSREATLQPIVIGVLGVAMGGAMAIRRAALIGAAIVVPLFVWIGAIKAYDSLELGPGPAYFDAAPAVREYMGLTWPQFVVGIIQDRFHGLDSLIVTQALVPGVRPFEEGTVWGRVLESAFVPRALHPDKQVGWGIRFAMEFWGMAPESEGRAAVGISHLGTFYVYGGRSSCVSGAAVLGAGLGGLAAFLRRRRDLFGPMLFVLTAITICQIDRDLEVVLGGVLKLLALCSIPLWFRPFDGMSAPLHAVGRHPA